MDTKPLLSPCHWTPRPSWPTLAIEPAVQDVQEKFLPLKKWWHRLDGTTVTVSDALFVANQSIRLQSVTAQMTKSTAGFATEDFGRYYRVGTLNTPRVESATM